MSEFRVKLECYSVGNIADHDDFYYLVNGIAIASIVLDALLSYTDSLDLRARGNIQFNHPTMGWVDIDDADSDDDLGGEAYLNQG